MDLASKKLELIQQFMLVSDEKILLRVADFSKRKVPDSEGWIWILVPMNLRNWIVGVQTGSVERARAARWMDA